MRAALLSSQYDHPSPKRKRADSTTDPATPPAVQSAPRPIAPVVPKDTNIPAPDSPRDRVTQQFSILRLKELDEGVRVVDFGDGNAGRALPTGAASKKLKVDADMSDSGGYVRSEYRDTEMLEIPETPQTSFGSTTSRGRVVPETPGIRVTADFQSVRRNSSPVPSSQPGNGLLTPVPIQPSNTPPPKQRSPSPVPTLNFFWQDSEITGHLGEDPEDDGFGINGVGFRPTPQIAQARTMKRRQQVNEWKTREAREARQKRSERRRGEFTRSRSETDGQRRVVRFA